MSNQYIICNFLAGIQGTGSRNEVTVETISLTRRSFVVKGRLMFHVNQSINQSEED